MRRVSSTTQSAAGVVEAADDMEGLRVANVVFEARVEGLVAMQKGEALLTQKTSRQQVVTPRLGGKLENCVRSRGLEELEALGCDCKRTRTTSKGVTAHAY